jgi:hypothetical protein
MALVFIIIWLVNAGGILSVGACWSRLRETPKQRLQACGASLTAVGTALGFWYVLEESTGSLWLLILLPASLVLVALITGLIIRAESDNTRSGGRKSLLPTGAHVANPNE